MHRAVPGALLYILQIAFLRHILAFTNTFGPKIKSKQLLCKQKVTVPAQHCRMGSRGTRARDPLGSPHSGRAAQTLSQPHPTKQLNQTHNCWDTTAAHFTEPH